MKCFFKIFLCFLFCVGSIFAADDQKVKDLSFKEVTELVAPENESKLLKLLEDSSSITTRTKNNLLRQAVLQHNISVVMPLLQAGAEANRWMQKEIFDYIKPYSNAFDMKDEDQKKRIAQFKEINGYIETSLKKQKR